MFVSKIEIIANAEKNLYFENAIVRFNFTVEAKIDIEEKPYFLQEECENKGINVEIKLSI